MKRLIPKTWTKIDVDMHHFDYSLLSSLFLCFTPWWFKSYLFTTTLSSFTDGLILSVTAMKSVGENNTDGFTNGSDPSV